MRLSCVLAFVIAAPARAAAPTSVPPSYFDNSVFRGVALSGGVRMIPIHTTKGTFRVWARERSLSR